MHELQSLLLQKLPRLGELTFGCRIQKKKPIKRNVGLGTRYVRNFVITKTRKTIRSMGQYWEYLISPTDNDYGSETISECLCCFVDEGDIEKQYKILGHPFTHADILEALGEDWAMRKEGNSFVFMYIYEDCLCEYHPRPLHIPTNLSDLSLPEYEETRKQLISLLK